MKELTKLQTELHCKKERKNGAVMFEYRSVEDITAALRPLLAKYSCSLIMRDAIVPVGDKIYLQATTSIINSDGEVAESTAFAEVPDMLAKMSKPQITGSCSSYARKYALTGLLCLDNSEADVDSLVPEDSHSTESSGTVAQTAAESAVAPAEEDTPAGATPEQVAQLIANCGSREQFEKYQRVYRGMLGVEVVLNACKKIAKKYPKK